MNRLVRATAFTFETDVVSIYLKVAFGAAGAPTLDTVNSKGVCNITRNVISITGTTTNASPTVTGVNTFVGLYNGMIVTGTNIPGGTTISSMNGGAGTITLSQNATGANSGLSVAGGQFRVQLGAQAGVRLDTYVKLLNVNPLFDQTTLQGSVNTTAVAPAALNMFLVGNTVSVRTVPPTVAANLTDASFLIQFGLNGGASFLANDPASGEVLRLQVDLSRSNAI